MPASSSASSGDVKALISLQICLFFHSLYAVALVPATLLLYIYKAIMLPYPPNAIGLEVTFVFVYALLEWVRLRLGELWMWWGVKIILYGRLFWLMCRDPATTLVVILYCVHHVLASRGNRTEDVGASGLAVLLGAPIIIFHVYLISLQTYVLRLDVILHVIAIVFCTLDMALGIFATTIFASAQSI